ncbi:LysE family translocator [Metabacillus iocasae]|uniref:RhtB (Resistance to homoserine/threonine) family protein n=1 Tax=Priestia iocasae TaxID=2291674 RepID=A0ABS2QWV5_9BACI|nr:LysE family translocator [Metabacillus iocasae]MBM7703945.1 RhtB (resistance to homoserine/threonine) family protein [Metabacillus iocasae]
MEQFWLFVTMAILLILLPGPDTAIATKNTLHVGKKGGMQTVLGTCCALCIHTLAAIIGLSALLVQSAFFFSLFKYVGALYLIYLGIKAFISLRNNAIIEVDKTDKAKASKQTSFFQQGFLTNLLNPKVAVFFLTFLPQFIQKGTDPFLPFLIMGMTYVLLTALWFVLYVSFIHYLRHFMTKPSTQTVMQSITGVVLIGFGIKLAFEKGQN